MIRSRHDGIPPLYHGKSRQYAAKSMVRLSPFANRPVQTLDALPTVKLRDVRRRFDRAAATFDGADFVHAVTRDGLLTRLEPLLLEANNILDLGSATSSAAAPLRKRFRRAHIVSLDVSLNMLRAGKQKQPRFSLSRSSYVQANATNLPFVDQSIDLVFSNLLLPCVTDPSPVFREVARVLRKDGVFAFATLGPDSLLEIVRAWRAVDHHRHVNQFLDMHDIGDAIVTSGLRDPVLDVDRLSVTYSDPAKLFADLTSVGARNALQQRNRSLVGKQQFAAMEGALSAASVDDSIELNLELVYGHCWGGGARRDPAAYRIDASGIPLRRG